MKNLVIAIGEHRNEKGAEYLGPLVAEELRKRAYNVVLAENPEKRTLLEIALDTYKEGKRLTEEKIEQILFGWVDILSKEYSSTPIFWFHNYGMNSTDFYPEDWQREYLEGVSTLPNLSKLPGFEDNSISRLTRFHPESDGAIMEIPDIQHRCLTVDQLIAVENVVSQNADRNYLLETNMIATELSEWLGDNMVNILSRGIDYIMQKPEVLQREDLYD